jgi:lipoyl-dependent peroxiredoxin
MSITSRADATWAGPLATGDGTVSGTSSGSFTSLPITWRARTEEHGGLTSPEELLAASHAACFAMALSGALARAETPPTKLEVAADVTFDKLDAWTVVSSHLTVHGTVPGISAADFSALAETTKDTCPISRAIIGNVALSVTATLD